MHADHISLRPRSTGETQKNHYQDSKAQSRQVGRWAGQPWRFCRLLSFPSVHLLASVVLGRSDHC
jgi:hypothetical protein